MAKVTYKPEAGVSGDTVQYGYEFKDGKPTEVNDDTPEGAKALAKFQGNRFFDVKGVKAKSDKGEPNATLPSQPAMPEPDTFETERQPDKTFSVIRVNALGNRVSAAKGLTQADVDGFTRLDTIEQQLEFIQKFNAAHPQN